jgi:biotin transport system substrate-specific component
MSVRLHSRASSWTREDIVTNRALRRSIGVATFAMATAFGAQVAIPLPGTPIPFTLQMVWVLLAGAVLGARLGAASQAAYLVAGALGAPVFAAGGGLAYLLGPTGGYLLAFPVAAFVVGAIAGRSLGTLRLLVGLIAGALVIQGGGAAWLAVTTGDIERAIRVGVSPFLLFALLKVALVLLISVRIRPRALELF